MQQVAEQADQTQLPPVQVSGRAAKVLAEAMRRWSGWPTARVELTPPPDGVSPYGSTSHGDKTFHIGVDNLVLNPNRVLNVVTPFRLRQEAVLTGVMLHEAGHARHTHWRPRTVEQCKLFVHGSGSVHHGEPVNVPTLKFAALMEEARIERLIVLEQGKIGAFGLAWTLRASQAAISPMTALAADPDQQIMDLITAWTLRAGKVAAYHDALRTQAPAWTTSFNHLLHISMETYLDNSIVPNASGVAGQIRAMMWSMIIATDDTGTFMVDKAREILDTLFPNMPPDDVPQPGGGCSAAGEGMPEHELEQSEAGEGEAGEGEAGESGEGEGESQDETLDPTQDGLAQALAQLETQADGEQAATTQGEAEKPPPPPPPGSQPSNGASAGKAASGAGGSWRKPTAAEREIQHGAERFLRDMVNPTVTSRIKIGADPSSSIDAAAYSAWKAAGQTSAPTFFKRTKRTVTSSPPVRVAVLVDVSMSMDVLAAPSALLSWALSAAAFDLRNFAGHGTQVESCLIHWGSSARVIQRNGEVLRGIHHHGTREYTDALGDAFRLVEQEMPGFLSVPEKPSNRLLVHFTDWALGATDGIAVQAQALMNGVNTLSVVPRNYEVSHSCLPQVLKQSQGAPGISALLKYDPSRPGQVWTRAAELLS